MLLDQFLELGQLLIAEPKIGRGVGLGQRRQKPDDVRIAVAQTQAWSPNAQGAREQEA